MSGFESEQRIRQFAHYLKLMDKRTREEAKDDCCLTFADGVENCDRHVRFVFSEQRFHMHLSHCTLRPAEADRILGERQGFFWAKDVPDRKFYGYPTFKVNPFWKLYEYGDEDTAAEDAAFVFFDTWKLPVLSALYVEAGSFGYPPPQHRWECGAPMAQRQRATSVFVLRCPACGQHFRPPVVEPINCPCGRRPTIAELRPGWHDPPPPRVTEPAALCGCLACVPGRNGPGGK